jgi:hypothetical protein
MTAHYLLLPVLVGCAALAFVALKDRRPPKPTALPPPHRPISTESRDAFFAADMMAQTLTMVHLIFHGLYIAAISQLITPTCNDLKGRLLPTILASVGFLAALISVFRELRIGKIRGFWETHYGDQVHFEAMRRKAPYQWVQRSRLMLTILLLVIYGTMFMYPWLE